MIKAERFMLPTRGNIHVALTSLSFFLTLIILRPYASINREGSMIAGLKIGLKIKESERTAH
jgi:hypothetical protein